MKLKEKLFFYLKLVNNKIVSDIVKGLRFLEKHSKNLLQIYVAITIVLITELFTDTIWISCLVGFCFGLYKEYLDERYGPGKDIRDLAMYSIGVIVAAIYLNLLKQF